MDSRLNLRRRSQRSSTTSISRHSSSSSALSDRRSSRKRQQRSVSSSDRSTHSSRSPSVRRYGTRSRGTSQSGHYGTHLRSRHDVRRPAGKDVGLARSRYSPTREGTRSRSPVYKRRSRSSSRSFRGPNHHSRNTRTDSSVRERAIRRTERARRDYSRSRSGRRGGHALRRNYRSPSPLPRGVPRRRRSVSLSSSASPPRGTFRKGFTRGSSYLPVTTDGERRRYPGDAQHNNTRAAHQHRLSPQRYPTNAYAGSSAATTRAYRHPGPFSTADHRDYVGRQGNARRHLLQPSVALRKPGAGEQMNGGRETQERYDHHGGRYTRPLDTRVNPAPRRFEKPGLTRRNPGPPLIDRSSTCPFLLRVYYNLQEHHSLEDLNQFLLLQPFEELPQDKQLSPKKDNGDELEASLSPTPSTKKDCKDSWLPTAKVEALHGSELQLYTWKDTSLREIVDLVKDVCPEARTRASRLSLKLLHLGDDGTYTAYDLGTLYNSRPGPDDRRTLLRSKFEIGDVVSIAIIPIGGPRNPNRHRLQVPATSDQAESSLEVAAANDVGDTTSILTPSAQRLSTGETDAGLMGCHEQVQDPDCHLKIEDQSTTVVVEDVDGHAMLDDTTEVVVS